MNKFDRMVVSLGSCCNLKCEGCNNLMPLFSKHIVFPAEQIIECMTKILIICPYISTIELIGGEPFLFAGLTNIIDYLICKNEIKNIEITTNGTIIPRDELLSHLRNEKVIVRISDYGTISHKSELIDLLSENDIRYDELNTYSWIDSGGIDSRNRSKDELMKQYKKCNVAMKCKTMMGDRVFACARAASLYYLKRLDDAYCLKVDEMMDEKSIEDFYDNIAYKSCDFCDINTFNAKQIPPAIQIM